MNRDLTHLPGGGEQPDPVAEFFDRERAGIRELPGGQDRWESIVLQAARPRRRHVLPYLAAAAAVVVVGGVVWGTGTGPDTDRAADPASRTSAVVPTTTVTVTRTVGPKVVVPPATDGASSAPSGQSSTTVLRTPVSFDLVSMSNAGGGHLYALGAAKCGATACTAVVASDDNGATWTTRASFTTLTTPGSRTTPDRAHQLVGIRMASEQVGYVFGSTTKRTTDGGRHWTDVDVDRRTVLSLETDGRQVWMATARSCQHNSASTAPRGCDDLEPRTGPVAAATTEAVRVTGMPRDGENAWIAMDGSDAYYNVTTPGRTGPAVAMRLSGQPGLLPVPEGCSQETGMWVSATANTRGALLAVCPSAGAPQEEYSLAASTDRGATWTTRPAPGLGRPTPQGVWLNATDIEHLVALRQGLPSSAGATDVPTTLLSSADGGASWSEVKVEPSGRVSWVGAAGGGLVYAAGGGLGYWLSHDSGATFESVPLRR